MVTSLKEKKGILALKEEYKKRIENYWNSMESISETTPGYDLWDGSRMAYVKVVKDLEELLK